MFFRATTTICTLVALFDHFIINNTEAAILFALFAILGTVMEIAYEMPRIPRENVVELTYRTEVKDDQE